MHQPKSLLVHSPIATSWMTLTPGMFGSLSKDTRLFLGLVLSHEWGSEKV
jgi:hypothetical protein